MEATAPPQAGSESLPLARTFAGIAALAGILLGVSLVMSWESYSTGGSATGVDFGNIYEDEGGSVFIAATLVAGFIPVLLFLASLIGGLRGLWVFAMITAVVAVAWFVYAMVWLPDHVDSTAFGATLALGSALAVVVASVVVAVVALRAR